MLVITITMLIKLVDISLLTYTNKITNKCRFLWINSCLKSPSQKNRWIRSFEQCFRCSAGKMLFKINSCNACLYQYENVLMHIVGVGVWVCVCVCLYGCGCGCECLQMSTMRFCSCVRLEPMCWLSGSTLILHSQWAHSMHFFWRSSRDMSTPPYDVDRDQILLCAWIIGKKFDRIMRKVSHARVKWLQNDIAYQMKIK